MAFIEKVTLKNFAKFTGKHLCQSLSFNKLQACNVIKKETLAQVFFCEFCGTTKNTFSTKNLPEPAFESDEKNFRKIKFGGHTGKMWEPKTLSEKYSVVWKYLSNLNEQRHIEDAAEQKSWRFFL